MTLRRSIMASLLLAGVVLTLWSCTAQVEPGERGVVMRFGRVTGTVGPGLYFGLPWGIDRVERVAVDQVRAVFVGYQPDVEYAGTSTPPGQLLTGDHNLVNVQVALIYSVDEDRVEDYVIQAERADSLVARAADTALAEWVAGRTVDEVLLHGKALLPAWLVQQTQARIAAYDLGIQIREEASVTYLYPPDEVRAARQPILTWQDQRTAGTAQQSTNEPGQKPGGQCPPY